MSDAYDRDEMPDKINAGEIWRAKIKESVDLNHPKDRKEVDRLVIVEEFTERFGCSSGLAFKVLGYHDLISPRFVKPHTLIPAAEYGMLIHEIHEQSSTLTAKLSKRILSLMTKETDEDDEE
jgi:hypothetical protein